MKLILSIIYWNEEAVIERFLDSFKPIISGVAAVRNIGTAEPDGTREKIAEWCVKNNVPARMGLYESDEWDHTNNFSAARNAAWESALRLAERTDATHIMWADCDDLLEITGEPKDAPDDAIGIVAYNVRGTHQVVHRERVVPVSMAADIKWRYPIHEQLSIPDGTKMAAITWFRLNHKPAPGRTTSSPRNKRILNRALEDTWRNAFYLHQEHFTANEYANARLWGKVALMTGAEGLERYETLLNMAQMAQEKQEAKALAAEAYSVQPDRREALALLASQALVDGENERALQLADAMMKLPMPTKTYWSLNREWYGWKGCELYCQCLRLNGKPEAAAEILSKARNGKPPMFSIIHATLNRTGQAMAYRELWMSRADKPEMVEYIFGLHEGDELSRKHLGGFLHTIAPDGCGCPTNYDIAAGLATGKIIVQAQDDVEPPQGWDTAILKNVPEYCAWFMATCDGSRGADSVVVVSTIMSRGYMIIKATREENENGFFHRGYTGTHADTENTYRARQDAEAGLCQYIEAHDITLEHHHPYFKPEVPWDSTYEVENNAETVNLCKALFMKRNPTAAPIKEHEYSIGNAGSNGS